jgi:hypothetical protein
MDIIKYDPSLPTLEGTTFQRYSRKLRLEVFTRLCGGPPRCMCPGCTVTFIDFLTCDHVNGGGMAHRKENKLGQGAAQLWLWIKRNGYPKGFQVLCRNCNGAKWRNAQCPLHGQLHC